MPSRVRVKRWEQERARAGRLESERIVLTSVRARGASRPRGEEHETTFAAAVEELPRRCLRRARSPQRRFESRRTQGVEEPGDPAAFARGTSNGAAVSTSPAPVPNLLVARAMACLDGRRTF